MASETSAEIKTATPVETFEVLDPSVDENQNPGKSILPHDDSSSSRSEGPSENTDDDVAMMDVNSVPDPELPIRKVETNNVEKQMPTSPTGLASSSSNITPLAKLLGNGGVTPSPGTPTSASKKRKRLTPDERIFREKERAEKRQKLEEEKQRKEEDKRRKEQERLDKLKVKEQERVEKERQKEQERLKREEVKEQERLKREEDILKKAEEKRKKEDERVKKEEEKRAKDEERRVKEEERKKLVDEKEKERLKLEEKKAKQAQHFTKFFQKSPATVNKIRTLGAEPLTARQKAADTESDKENKVVLSENEEAYDEDGDLQVVLVKKFEASLFSPMPFQIKTHMAIAPLVRRVLAVEERATLDKCFECTEDSLDGSVQVEELGCKSDFVESLKGREPRRSGRTKVEYEAEPELILIEDVQAKRQYRWKLVQFHDNRRPAYWGTWIRKPLKISGRRPFAKEGELDYEFDSDDEWEDEPEDAEEIENSDGEEEPQDPAEGEPVDEDDEEGWMVPHGYLSDTEREGEQMDLETVKNKEKEFYRSLKEQVKMGLPVIQTEDLLEFRISFPPVFQSRIRKSKRTPKPPSKDSVSQSKGFLALDLPSDDEEDREWDDTSNNDGDREGDSDEESSSDSDDTDSGSEGDDEDDLDEVMEEESDKMDESHSLGEDESMEDEESVVVDANA